MIDFGPIIAGFRESIAEELRKTGMPASEAGLVADLSVHAVSEAMMSIERVTERSPKGNHAILIRSIAWPIVSTITADAARAGTEAAEAIRGAKIFSATVSNR